MDYALIDAILREIGLEAVESDSQKVCEKE